MLVPPEYFAANGMRLAARKCARLTTCIFHSAKRSIHVCGIRAKSQYKPAHGRRHALSGHFSAALDGLSLSHVRLPLPATSISPARAIFATSGAIPPGDGRRVRWRQIFRSNHLGHVTEADIEGSARPWPERAHSIFAAWKSVLAASVRACRRSRCIRCRSSLPSSCDRLRARRADGTCHYQSADALDVMRDSYRNYVRDRARQATARCSLTSLEDRAPLVIHCTAGKDRTGFACALDPACARRAGGN